MVKDMETLVNLCKGRGFIYAGSEIYGGLANSWDYGPLGSELKNNIKKAWMKKFIQERNDSVAIDSSLLNVSYKWSHMVYGLSCLVSFTLHHISEVHPG